MALVRGIGDGLEELDITPGTADIFGRTVASAGDEPRTGDARAGGSERFEHDRAAPIIPVVVDVFEDAFAIFGEAGELKLTLAQNVAVFGRGLAIERAVDLEVMQVAVVPAHDVLNNVVQALEGEVGRDLDPSPDSRIYFEQCDFGTDDHILHVASMVRTGFQFQGRSSPMRLAG